MSSDNYPRNRRSRDSIVAHNKLALYEDPIFDTPYEEAAIIDDYGWPLASAPDFINPAIVIDSEAECEDDFFPDRLRLRIEYQTHPIDMDAIARDIVNDWDPEDVTIRSTAWDDDEIDVEAIERKITNTAANGNPLADVDRTLLSKMPWLPYIAAIREYMSYPAGDSPKFIGDADDIEKIAGIIHRLPTEGETYWSPVGEAVKELVRKTALVKQANLIERVTQQVRTRGRYAVQAGEVARRTFEDTERDEETFVNNDGPFGMDEPSFTGNEREALAAGIRKHIPLVAADVTNTKVAKFFFDQNIQARQATMLLQQRQFDPTRVAKVLQLMAAYQKTSAK